MTGLELDALPGIITQVSGRLNTPSEGLSVTIAGAGDISPLIVGWRTLEWSEVGFGAVGSAAVELDLWDPDQTISIPELAELVIAHDGTANIAYSLAWGDVRPGSLARQFKGTDPRPSPQPAYRFIVTVEDPGIPEGFVGASLVTAQLTDAAENPMRLAGISMTWLLTQWTDDALTLPGDAYSLDDASGATDTLGRAYTWLRHGVPSGDDSVAYQIEALAMPV
jgi:hypothetical protein